MREREIVRANMKVRMPKDQGTKNRGTKDQWTKQDSKDRDKTQYHTMQCNAMPCKKKIVWYHASINQPTLYPSSRQSHKSPTD